MKRTFIKTIALVLALVTMTCFLTSCGTKLSGKYSSETFGTGVVYEFDGNKVFITVKFIGFSGESTEGEYKIKGDEITFIFETDSSNIKKYEGTFDFEKGENYIKIAGVKYEKVD